MSAGGGECVPGGLGQDKVSLERKHCCKKEKVLYGKQKTNIEKKVEIHIITALCRGNEMEEQESYTDVFNIYFYIHGGFHRRLFL